MELALISLSGVAGALLTLAVFTALAARTPRPLGAALILLAGLGFTGLFAGVSLFSMLVHRGTGGLLAGAIFVAGAIVIVIAGRRPAAPGLPARAAEWPLPRLGLLWLVVAVIFGTSARNALLGSQQALAARASELASLDQLFWPGVPLPLNAAPLYARAYQELVPLDQVPGAQPALEALWTKGPATAALVNAPALAEWVRRNGGAAALALEGTRKPGYASIEDALWRGRPSGGRQGKILRLEMSRKGHDPSTVDNILSRRRIGDLLQTRSLQRAFAGDLDGAVEDANAVVALADQTASSWLKPERLIAKLLAAPNLTAAALAGLRLSDREPLDVRLQRLLIRGEHAELTLWQSAFQTTDPVDALFKGTQDVLWAQDSLQRMERAYDGLWEAAYAPPASRVRLLREAEERIDALRVEQFWPRHVALGLEGVLHDEAERVCTLAAVAVQSHRLAHGEWPKDLASLLPRVPGDPFDGAPLRYQSSAAEARVYSVGPDLRDGHGDGDDVTLSLAAR